MIPLIELSEECGARVLTNGVEHRITFDGAQLTAFAERIREDERERAETDAKRYRWLRKNRFVTLITMWFGNGCVNKTIEDAEAKLDAAIDAAIREEG
jgi:hypothetical protein